MSEENVELAHRAHKAFNRRDLDGFLALMDAEVELTTRFMELEGDRSYRGHDGVSEWWRSLLGIFPDFGSEVLEVRDLGGDFVLVIMRARGHGRDSGTPFEETLWQASKWRRGRVVWWQMFGSEAEALEAAGLEE